MGAPQCGRCGTPFTPLTGAGHTASVVNPFDAPKQTPWWLIGVGALALIALGFTLSASGVLRLPGQQPDAGALAAMGGDPDGGLLRTDAQSTAGVTYVEGGADSGLTQDVREVPPGMPQDVYDWLEHLRRTEEARGRISEEQLSSALVSLTMLQSNASVLQDLMGDAWEMDLDAANPANKVKTDMQSKRSLWSELSQYFNSYPPPAECVPIRNEYDQVIRETGGMMIDILGALERASENPQDAIAALIRMRGTSANRIDRPAQRSDALVYDICQKYGVQKWFSIRSDMGGGMFSQFKGL